MLNETFKRFDERIDVAQFMPPMPEQMQTQVIQNQIMQQMMMGGGAGQQGGVGPAAGGGMPSQMTQQFNEASNVPNNRADQRERNQYRQPSS